ncbi:MerR family transcriptional regulator [Kocuria polaris]|nr:MerR family transcriptional regulator [Kocuria polaris]
MKIGEVAERLGVEVHVLRHWDDMGVVVADRTAAGHRQYTGEHVQRLRVLMRCREVGLSLAEIRGVLHRDEAGRRAVIEDRLGQIRKQRGELDAAESFLTHVLECRHSLLTRCPDCSEYAGSAGQRR